MLFNKGEDKTDEFGYQFNKKMLINSLTAFSMNR
jgi:hypothetical protein